MMLGTEVRRTLKRIGIVPDRSLGQNFLISPSIAMKIAAEVPCGESVLEIGPGLGSLTDRLAGRCGKLTAVEISGKMAAFLRERYSEGNVDIVNGDFLATDPAALPGFPFRTVVGNLPYSISSPVLFRLLEDAFSRVETAILMLQREVARRLTTLDGGRDYGKLSLQMWPFYQAEILLEAGAEDFYPAPEVMSSVVVMKRRSMPLVRRELQAGYRRLVRIAFAMRRKTILNNLRSCFSREDALRLLLQCGVDPGLRAEEIPPEKYVEMAEVMF